MNKMGETLFDNLIDIIKFVRSMGDIGLFDAKNVIVEIWARAYGYGPKNWIITDFRHVQTLAKIVGRINRGDWVIKEGEIFFNKKVNPHDVFELENVSR